MVRIGLDFIIYALFIILVGCEAGPSVKNGTSTDPTDVLITYPSNNSVLNRSIASNLSVRGTCVKNGEIIDLVTGGLTQTTICTNKKWQATLNVSSFADGPVQVIASNRVDSHAISVYLQTQTSLIYFLQPVAPTSFFGDDFLVKWVSGGDLRDTNTFLVEIFANSVCSGTPFNTNYQTSMSYVASPLTAGVTYSLRVRAYDSEDIEGTPSCSGPFTPTDTPPTLSLSDPTTLSTTHVRQVATRAAITNLAIVKKWCLSEVETTPPAENNPCFRTTRPTSITLASGDGVHTVYLWVQDQFENVLTVPTTDTIILDTVRPLAPTVALSDPFAASADPNATKQALNDISITNDADAVAWCVTDQPTPSGIPPVPAWNSTCFTTTEPTTYTLSARGLRTVFVYTRDAAGNVSVVGSGQIRWLVAADYIMLVGNKHLHPNVCIPIQVKLLDEDGDPSAAGPGNYRVILSREFGNGSFYALPSCSGTPSSVLTIAPGDSQATIYYFTSSAELLTLKSFSSARPALEKFFMADIQPRTEFALSSNGHNCIADNGQVQCWGLNNGTSFGQSLNLVENFYLPTARKIASIPNATDLTVGKDHVCAIVNGSIRCWGQNTFGQLGTGNFVESPVPVSIGLATIAAYEVSAGAGHTCAVISSRAYCWGRNDRGQTGAPVSAPVPLPTEVAGLGPGVTHIEASEQCTCAIKFGEVYCWGRNDKGQLGNGTTIDSAVPVLVDDIFASAVDLQVSDTHACIIHEDPEDSFGNQDYDSELKCWGTSPLGGLGEGTLSSTTAVVVTDQVDSFAIGRHHGCTVKSDDVQCWGANFNGQFGSGGSSTTIDTTPGGPITSYLSLNENALYLTAAGSTTCVRDFDNDFACAGSDANNALGRGTFTESNVPVTVTSLTGTPESLSIGSTQCVTMTDDSIQCWGRGEGYQIGTGFPYDRGEPVSLTATSTSNTSTSDYSSCTVSATNIRCWGTNVDLRLGRPAGAETSNGGNVQGITGTPSYVDVSKHGSHACAVVGGGVMCWGNSASGRLGLPVATPVNVDTAAFVQTLGAGSGATKVVTGNSHTCALVADAVYCWGQNARYQLGNNVTTDSDLPVLTIATSATDIAAAGDYTCAVVGGVLQCWGRMDTLGTLPVPTAHADLNANVERVSTGEYNVCVIMTDLTVRCFGEFSHGRLGNASVTADTNASIDVTGITAASDIAVTNTHACAIDGTAVKCWGLNYYGAFGNASFDSGLAAPVLEP